MFQSQLVIYGKGAELLKKYSKDKQGANAVTFTVTDNLGEKKDIHLFENYCQGYMAAALLGIYHGEPLYEDNPDRSIDAKIFPDMLMKHRRSLEDIVQIMILSQNDNNVDRKIRKAFTVQREKDDEVELERLLTGYAKRGLFIIDEKFSNCKTYEDVANQILLFKQELSLED